MKGQLDDYRRRRDFRRTGEPRGADRPGGSDLFVVQHHAASSDHYDVRLEVDGVLRSWAVPKGPSTDPRDRRLAVPTEDHPLDYADFEGTIPAGEYGGGTVQVWDRGTYRNTTRHRGAGLAMADGLERGHVTVELDGDKLSGGYSLTRFRGGPKEAWLLIKRRDQDADARRDPVRTEVCSALTGRGMDDIARESQR